MPRLRLFGHPALEANDSYEALNLPAKAIVLVGLLAANAERPLAREWLAYSLWPDLDPSDARANLRRHLHLAAKAIGESAFIVARQTVQWNRGTTGIEADVVQFDLRYDVDPDGAIDVYAGDLCAGIADEALDAARLRYRSRYEHLVRMQIEAARRAADGDALRVALERAIAFDPHDEEAVRELMRLRVDAGDRAGALRDYAALRQRLAADLDTEPQAETTDLFARIASVNADAGVCNNLPLVTTTFVGRERERAAVAAALAQARAVAIFGPGGSGKSRLALRVASDLLSSSPDGVWFVELERATAESDIWESLLTAMRAKQSGDAKQSALANLRAKRSLIVFDTCEHVHAAAEAAIHALLEETNVRVIATSRKRMNVDGMEQVALRGLDVPPEQILPGDSALRYSAYRLFIERAALVNPSFRVRVEQAAELSKLLRSIDGSPLAIELVASRANVFSLEAMRRNLATAMRGVSSAVATSRSRSLDAALEWSFALLSPDERRMLLTLSLFESRFSLEDAEAVCKDVDDPALRLIDLVDASLVNVVGEGADMRYRLLEITAGFARARLSESPFERDALGAYVDRMAENADRLSAAAEHAFAELLDGVLATMPDYLSAIDRAVAIGLPDTGARIFEGIYRFGLRQHARAAILRRGYLLFGAPSIGEGARARVARVTAVLEENVASIPLLEHAVAYYRDRDDVRLAHALGGLAGVYFRLGRYEECRAMLLEAKDIIERTGDERLLVRTIGRLATFETEYERARAMLEPVIDRLIALGDLREAGQQLKNLAGVAFFSQRYDEAIALADRAIELVSATAELAMHAILHSLKGCAFQLSGNVEASLRAHVQAQELIARIGTCAEAADVFEDAAMTLTRNGAYEDATFAFGFSEEIRRMLDSPKNPAERPAYDAMLQELRRQLGAGFDARYWAGARDTVEAAARRATVAMQHLLSKRMNGGTNRVRSRDLRSLRG